MRTYLKTHFQLYIIVSLGDRDGFAQPIFAEGLTTSLFESDNIH